MSKRDKGFMFAPFRRLRLRSGEIIRAPRGYRYWLRIWNGEAMVLDGSKAFHRGEPGEFAFGWDSFPVSDIVGVDWINTIDDAWREYIETDDSDPEAASLVVPQPTRPAE